VAAAKPATPQQVTTESAPNGALSAFWASVAVAGGDKALRDALSRSMIASLRIAWNTEREDLSQ